MSQYIPTVWRNNEVPSINAANLNHMEAGIVSSHNEIEDMISGATPVGRATTSLIATTIVASTRIKLGGVRMWVDSTGTVPIGHLEV